VDKLGTDHQGSTDYDYLEWRGWYNVLRLAIVLAIVIVISR